MDNTKKALADALKELMQKKHFSKISIQDITDESRLSRKTFYYHFKDKYELVKWIYDEDVLPLVLNGLTYSNWKQSLYRLLEYFYENHNFYKNLISKNEYASELSEYFSKIVRGVVVEIVNDAQGDSKLNDIKKDFLIKYYTNAFGASIMEWLSAKEMIPPKELISMVYDITNGSLADFILKHKT